MGREDECNGMAILYYPDGKTYTGAWKDGKRHGKGVYTWPNDARYIVTYLDGKNKARASWRALWSVSSNSKTTTSRSQRSPTEENAPWEAYSMTREKEVVERNAVLPNKAAIKEITSTCKRRNLLEMNS